MPPIFEGRSAGAELTLDDELPIYDVDAENSLLFYVVENNDDKGKSVSA